MSWTQLHRVGLRVAEEKTTRIVEQHPIFASLKVQMRAPKLGELVVGQHSAHDQRPPFQQGFEQRSIEMSLSSTLDVPPCDYRHSARNQFVPYLYIVIAA